MNPNVQIIHLKHSKVTCSSSSLDLRFLGTSYSLFFTSDSFDSGKGVVLECVNSSIQLELLLWLSVYFGEDFVDPRQEMDTRQSHNRGRLIIDGRDLQRFLAAVERSLGKRQPKWKKRLFDDAIRYYSVALRGGLSLMPLTIGFFGMSMECVGNYVYGKQDKYFTLGKFSFTKLINIRFKRYKNNDKFKAQIRKWQSYIVEDARLIHQFRNSYYGHSMMHLYKDRVLLTRELRKWLIRGGVSMKEAKFLLKPDRIDLDIQIHAPALYKIGLRSTRLLIFMLLGFSTSIPFAEFDYLSFSNLPKGEVLKFNGISMQIMDKIGQGGGKTGRR